MIPKECKRLAEVDFPIAAVSRHAAREKSIRHGHPSTLHLWWARRPLASCRAVLLALLWPDPCDPLCPAAFKEEARKRLAEVPHCNPGATDEDLRKALLRFIADFANWDNAAKGAYLEVSRALVKAAYPEEAPLVVDPFAGGGSIPLEALRVGCEAFASDLNPVACLILKVMLEDIPRWGTKKIKVKRQNGEEIEADGLAEALRVIGKHIKEAAEKELAEFYPKDADGSIPIAYLWARTVRCEAPNCGAEIPLVRSFWLCKKANRKRALRPVVSEGCVRFEIFEPESDSQVPEGTVSRARARCLVCGAVLPPERVRTQLSSQRGGADVLFDEQGRRTGGARLLAVVTLKPGEQGRHYRLPTERDDQAVWKAQTRLKAILDEWERGGRQGLCPVPDEPLPLMSGTFNAPLYGMNRWGDLFTARQKLALVTLSRLVRGLPASVPEAVQHGMAIVANRMADGNSSISSWLSSREEVKHAFARQALPIVWDFAEVFPFADASRGYQGALDWVVKVTEAWPQSPSAHVQPADATEHPLPDETATVWFTDPPYYFAVPYADLSDFFFVWLKRALPGHPLLRDPFDPANPLTPKAREICEMSRWDPVRYGNKNKAFFEEGMRKAFAEGRRILREDGVGAVVFAHKTTEGWEALLSGMIRGGWTITGSWPIATEMGSRLRARESAALATSIHLICRPRPEDAPVGDWSDVLRELPRRVGHWVERLQAEGIRGADLVFACIGPALEIFSRYSRVETADGRQVQLPEFLEKVWEVVGRTALENVLGTAEAKARNGLAGALEEDARLTALFLWTLQSSNGEPAETGSGEAEEEETADEEDEEEEGAARKAKGYALVFDVVRRFAQPLGIELPRWEGRVIETKKGIVRLLSLQERARILFGRQGAEAVAFRLEQAGNKEGDQMDLFAPEAARSNREEQQADRRAGRSSLPDEAFAASREATTLDRVHTAMWLQASGQTTALRALLKAETERGPDFLRLANALSALYPKDSEEKRLLDAMLLAVPR